MIGYIIGLLATIFWIWMLIHAITNKGLASGEKVVWVLVVIFLPLLGSIIYYFLGKPKGGSSMGV
jgi:hypothetical protein